MTVLITGLGYIGSQLAADLLARGESVIAVENFFSTSRRQLRSVLAQPRLRLVQGSVTRPETLESALSDNPVRAIVHLAAQASAHPEAASQAHTEKVNLGGPRLVFEAAARHNVPLVLLGSSFWVYGDDLPPVVDETQPYGVAKDLAHLGKLYLEKLGEMTALSGGPRCIAARIGITHGLGPVVKTDPRFMTVPHRFCQLVAQGRPLTIHPSAIRPAGYVKLTDVTRALVALLDAPWQEKYRAVNVASEALTARQVADVVLSAAARRDLAEAQHPKAGPRNQVGQSIRIRSSLESLGAAPSARLEDSVDELLEYFLHVEQQSANQRRASLGKWRKAAVG